MTQPNKKRFLLFILGFSFYSLFSQSITILPISNNRAEGETQIAVVKNGSGDQGYVIFHADRRPVVSGNYVYILANYYNLSNTQVGTSTEPMGGGNSSEYDNTNDWQLVTDNNLGMAASFEQGSKDATGFYTINTSTGAITEVLNETAASGTSGLNGAATVGILNNGNLIFVYANAFSSGGQISFDIINPNTGAAVVSGTSVTTTAGSPTVTTLSDGGFFIAYAVGPTSPFSTKGKRYNSSGTLVGSEVTIFNNTSTVSNTTETTLSNGNVLIQESGKAKIYDFSGGSTPVLVGGEISIYPGDLVKEEQVNIQAFKNGGFVTVFVGSDNSVFQNLGYRVFDNNGNPATSSQIDITSRANIARVTEFPDVATFSDGSFVVSYGNNSTSTGGHSKIERASVKNMHPIIDLDSNNSSGGIGTNYTATTLNGQTGGVAVVDSDVLLTDADGEDINSVKIEISNHLDGANEFLTLTSASGITITGSGTKTLTLTSAGSATKANFQTALQNIRYQNTTATNTTTRNIIVTVTDKNSLTVNATTTIAITTASTVVDNTAPTISSVTVPSNATYTTSQNLDFTVNFNENITVVTTGGTPQLAVTIGSTTRQATYVSGNGSTSLLFRYTVQSGDLDTNGIAVGALASNGGTLRDAASNNATLTLNSVGSTSNVLVDASAPTVSSVTVPSNATYTTSQNLDFTVNFNENITVVTTGGTPQLAVTIGSTARQASYVSGSGSTALLFRYTVQSGESDSDGIAVGALVSNGGTLRDAASNNATLTLNSVGATSSVLVDSTAPTFENSTPATANVEDIYFRIDIDLDEAGKAYYVVLTDGATAPTSAEVKAGTGSGGASVTTSGNNTSISDTGKFHVTSVTAATSYDVYVVAEDNNGNLQASPTKLDVTTAAASINFRWTTANGTNTVTETVNGITATISNTENNVFFNNLNDFAGSNYNLIGLGGSGVANSVKISFSSAINLTSIKLFNLTTASDDWILTPTGGSNSAIEASNILLNTPKITTLNWTNITSFTITQKSGGNILFVFDEIVVTPVSKPTISSSAASSITANAATLNGNVTADGGATITERGFVYAKTSDNNDPEISGSDVTKQTVTGTTGTFNFAASSLSSSTQYSFKSYAKNSAGTSYGSVLTFTTSNTNPTLTAFSGSVITTNDNTTAEITFTDLKAKGDENDDVSVDAFIVKSFPSNGTLKIGTSSGTATDYDSSTNNTIDATKNAYFISTENLNGSYNIFTVVAKDNVDAESSTAIQVPITINDATTPTVLEVTSDKTNGTYGVGTAINIYVQYSEEVLVTGTPQLTLETGTTDRVINYVDRSSSTLRFVYTVQTGDESADLDVLSSSALSLNSGTIKDAANNIASLTVQQGATAGSLSQNKDLVINATVPVVSTTDATSIVQQSATLAGNVTSIGGSAVTERGILYSITSTNAAPVVGGAGVTKDTNGTGSGVYTESITGLTPSTQYSFVAYAINSSGTVYGTVKTFTTSALLTPTITFANISKTYGDANFDLNATSNSSGTISYSIVGSNNGTSLSGTNNKTVALGNAATVTIRASQTANGIYKAETKDITLTISKATLTVTTEDKSREYGDANPTFTINYSGFKGSDDASSLDTAPSASSTATATTNVDDVDITVSGGSDTNYDFSYTNGTLTINKASITATADDKSREYGDANPTFTITYSGFKGSDDASSLDTAPSASATATATTNVGNVDIIASGGSDTNYNFSYTNGTLTINKASLTVNADDKSREYGDANPTFTITYSGFKGSDDASSLDTAPSATSSATSTTNVGDVDITASGGSDTNYDFSYTHGTLTINKANITATADNKSREYGDANPTFTITYSGFKGSDDASSLDTAPSAASTATSTTNVGNVDITVSGGSDTNYDFSYTNGTLTINKASVTATADDKSREYGDSNPTFTITYSGFKGSDNASSLDTAPSATSSATSTTNVGSVDITASGGSDTNYNFSYTNGALTINKRAITVSADGGLQKLVGNADPVFTYSITVGNVVNGDSPTGVLRRSPGESFGNYAINLGTLNYGTNYNTTFVGSTFNISFVITTGTSAVSATSAAITGESPITGVSERGVLYSSTNTDPQVGGNDVTKVVDNTTIGPFNVTITGLDPSTKYYFRTYVILTTDGGKRNTTQYGTIKSVITPASEPMSTSYSPVDNSTLINPTSNLNITFDKDIQKGTGDIEIRKKSDNSLIETIDVVSANVTINSNEAIINPTIDLPQTTEVYIQIPIGAFKDLVDNNWSGIADTETWSFTTSDTFGPVITNLAPLDEATIVNPTSDLVITFDEPITKGTGNITINDDINSVIISSIDIATSTNISISGNTLTISSLTLPERNDIYILMDSGTVKDASNNNFGGINVKTVWNFSTGDITSPTVTISSTNQNPTNQNIAATFTFNEDVTGFDISDIIIGNGTASNFIAVDKKIYTATITPINDGEVTIDVNANVAKDDYNNDNTAATQFNINYDNTRPSVIISSDKNVATNTAFTVTATFSEDVTRFDVNDITITNATISNFTAVNGKEYTATITPINQGNLTIDIDENKAFDAARNKNTAADQFTLIYDTVVPTLVLSSAVGTYTNDSFTINATFSEDVTDFDVSDLTLVNATATNFNVVNAKEYSVTINPTVDGEVTIDVNADVAQDAATNQNTASNQIKTIYDNTIPTVEIISNVPNNTNINNFDVTIKFSENVSGFDINDIVLANATASNFTITSAKEYSAKITAISEGEITVDVNANVAQDVATNLNTASTNQVKTIFDNTKPTVIISSSVPNPTNSNFTARFTFSENVSGFDINDIVLANAIASNFSILSTKEYTALITPIADGEITIDINASAGMDVATNPNTAATQFKTVYDGTKPNAPIITSLSDYTCAGNTSITGDNKIILYGTAEANSIVTLSINGVPKTNITVDSTGNWVYDNSASILPDNVYLFTAITTDSAGNVSDFSNQFNISINTADNDTDGNPDFCDDDDDNDGVLDGDDNSPLIPNPGQEDTDGDGVADVDEDCDNDGIINYYDTDNSDCTTTIAQKKKYGFSPNGDGINDNWTIDNIELYPSNVVKVYNRSGRLVYRAYGYKNTWNGISNRLDGNNKKLPSGPYLYIIELNKDNQKPIQGWLYINY